MNHRLAIPLACLLFGLNMPLPAQRLSPDIDWMVLDDNASSTFLTISPDSKHVAVDHAREDIWIYAMEEGELNAPGELESVIPYTKFPLSSYRSPYVRYMHLGFVSNNSLLIAVSFLDTVDFLSGISFLQTDLSGDHIREVKRHTIPSSSGSTLDVYRGGEGVFGYRARDIINIFNAKSESTIAFPSRYNPSIYGPILLVGISDDGSIVALRQNRYYWLAEIATGKIIAEREFGSIIEYRTMTAPFMSDNRSILCLGYDNILRAVNLETGEINRLVVNGALGSLYAPKSNDMALSPGGNYAATASEDGIIHLWDLRTGEEVYTYDDYQGIHTELEFTPDGEHLVSFTSDGALISWNVPAFIKSSDNVSSVATTGEGRIPFSTSATFDRGSSSLHILLDLPERSDVRLDLYDLRGERVGGRSEWLMEKGKGRVEYNLSNLPDGIYLYRIVAGERIGEGKVIVQQQ